MAIKDGETTYQYLGRVEKEAAERIRHRQTEHESIYSDGDQSDLEFEIRRGGDWKRGVVSILSGVWFGFRWIVFIPAGIIGGFVIALLVALLIASGGWMYGVPWDAPINRLFAAGVAGASCVFAGAYTAPSRRKSVPAYTMMTIMISVYVLAFLVNVMDGFWMKSFQCVAGVIGAVLSASHLASEDPPKMR